MAAKFMGAITSIRSFNFKSLAAERISIRVDDKTTRVTKACIIMECVLPNAVVQPANLISGAMPRFRQLAARLEGSFRNVAMALCIHQTLEELPDGVLKDLGLARSEIPFVAGELASRQRNPKPPR